MWIGAYRSNRALYAAFALLLSAAAQGQVTPPPNLDGNPCAASASPGLREAACPGASAPVCSSSGGIAGGSSDGAFMGCYRPQTTTPVAPSYPGVGSSIAPTDPPPSEPGEEKDRGRGDDDDGQECGGNPIDIASGNKYQVETDYVGPGALPLRIVRHYNSKGAGWSIHKGLFGQGWTSNFEDKIVAFEETAVGVTPNVREVLIQNETGHRFKLTSTDDGPWLNTSGREVVFFQNPDDDYWTYNDGPTVKVFQPTGHIDSITHENGQYLTFHYSEYVISAQLSDLQLDTVRHSSGAEFSFGYDSGRRITSITDSLSNVYTYTYGGVVLVDVELPAANGASEFIKYKYEHPYEHKHLTGIQYPPATTTYASWDYDNNGLATSSEHHVNIEQFDLEMTADTPTTVTRTTTNVHGKETVYTFTKVGGLFRSSSVSGAAHGTCLATNRSSTYDAKGYYDKVTDREGNVTDYDHDAYGQVTKITTGFGTSEARTTDFVWDNLNNKVTRITTPLLQTDIELGARGRTEKITMTNKSSYGVANQVREWRFDYTEYTGSSIAQTVVVDGPRPGNQDITTFNYASNGLLTSVVQKVTASLNLTTSYSNYDAMGRVGRIVTPSGEIRDYEYDPRGRMTKLTVTVDGVATETIYQYRSDGTVWNIVYSDGSNITTYPDAARRIYRILHDDADTDANDVRRREFAYDSASNLTREEIWVKDWGWVNDPGCNPSVPTFPICPGSFQITDVEKFYREYEYDSLDRLTKIEYSYSADEAFEYDKNDRLKTVEDGRFASTSYSRNANNDIGSTTHRDGGVSQVTYDAQGQVSGVRDALGQWTYYRRDGFGQVIELQSPATGLTKYEYDAAGNRTKKTDARLVELNYEYDNLNRLEKVFVGSSSTPIQTFTYDIDEPGHLYSVTDDVGTHTFLRDSAGRVTSKSTDFGSGTVLTTGYRYDAHGRLDRITYPSGLNVTYGFNSFGEVDAISATGAGLSTTTVASSISYYPWGPLESMTFGNGEIRSKVALKDYTVYKINSGTHIARTLMRDGNNNITGFDSRTYTYDAMDRLKTHTGPDGSYEYDYDLNGNRNWHKRNSVQTTYSYNTGKTRLNTLSGGNSESRSYDTNGNTIQIGNRYFDHDDTNRFWRYREGSTTVTYTHNAFGERQVKQQGSTTTRFVYDGPNLLHERVGSTKRDYIYLDGEIVGLVHNGVLYYVHNDHLGRPEVVTNSAKSVVWSSQNDAFSNTPGTDLIGNLNVGFPGQYYDIESGMYYNYFRTYDGLTGRYLQSDPIGLGGGLNTYSYVEGNPLSFIDPYGLSKFDKLFGLPKKFWNWYHRKEKKRGDDDLTKEEAEELYEDWKNQGKPGPDSKRKQGGFVSFDLLEWLIPWPLMPSPLACGELDCDNNGIPDHEEEACE